MHCLATEKQKVYVPNTTLLQHISGGNVANRKVMICIFDFEYLIRNNCAGVLAVQAAAGYALGECSCNACPSSQVFTTCKCHFLIRHRRISAF